MSRRFTLAVVLPILLAAGVASAHAWKTAAASEPALPLHLIGDFPLTGNATRFDYVSMDRAQRTLWLAHMGDGSVEAFDVKDNRVRLTVPLTPTASVRGILSAHGKVYAAAQGLGSVVVLKGESGERLASVPAGDVNGLAYDPVTRRVFVSDQRGGRDVVIDGRTNAGVGSVILNGEAGNTQYDTASRHIFVGVQDHDELGEIDPSALKVVRRYALPGCRLSHSVMIDSGARAAYVGCKGNLRIVRLDLRTGRVTASGDVGAGVDVLALDPGLHRLYVASESGVVSVYDVGDGRLQRLGQAFLALNAHVVGVDSATHRVYFPLQDVGGKPIMRVMEPR